MRGGRQDLGAGGEYCAGEVADAPAHAVVIISAQGDERNEVGRVGGGSYRRCYFCGAGLQLGNGGQGAGQAGEVGHQLGLDSHVDDLGVGEKWLPVGGLERRAGRLNALYHEMGALA